MPCLECSPGRRSRLAGGCALGSSRGRLEMARLRWDRTHRRSPLRREPSAFCLADEPNRGHVPTEGKATPIAVGACRITGKSPLQLKPRPPKYQFVGSAGFWVWPAPSTRILCRDGDTSPETQRVRGRRSILVPQAAG